MLFLLTLGLLASPACRAQEMQGLGGGTYFYVQGEDQGEIRAIRVFVGILGFIKGIQLRFGSAWSAHYGAPGGRARELTLRPGERVIAADGRALACVWRLRWVTSAGREAAFGRPLGRPFRAQPAARDARLLTVNGQHRLLCLSGIGFKWGSAPEGPATPTRGPATPTRGPATPTRGPATPTQEPATPSPESGALGWPGWAAR
ncbi:prostatic spermine-binding protein-like [Dipodomys merriami]|uniref:prostatic spermine-binding protein-like n=1 Tax=Dipodomys merriami TaxID=94247 RepID=UPI003855C6F6